MTRLHARFDPAELPDEPAVYLFARRFGLRMEVLYVGKATSLRRRIRQQLNNLKLMQAIDEAAIGPRMLFYGTFNCKPGQRVETILEIVERALIDHYTEAGDQLINKLGTKLPVDVIEFDGNLLARRSSSRQLRVPKRRGRGGDVD
ncbi:MAG TPA: GIY-YIG nuclease family protein [Thermoanaerobaculia bacterium]|nr:GIY-YIG nuclease family protein [Thermoanaerobaculia bacterium]